MKKQRYRGRGEFERRRQMRLARHAARRKEARRRARLAPDALRGPHIARMRSERIPAILDYYADRVGVRPRIVSGRATIPFPPVFSFIEEPEAALATLNAIVGSSGWGTRELFLDHSECEVLDHGAVSVVAALANEARSRRVFVNGRNSRDEKATQILWSVGAPRVLRYARGELPEGFLSFELERVQTTRRTRARSSTRHELVVQRVEQHLSECVERFGCRLTDKSKARLGGLLGEVCGNAEEHPGRPDWWVSAYLMQDGQATGTCYLTIFTLGETRVLPRFRGRLS